MPGLGDPSDGLTGPLRLAAGSRVHPADPQIPARLIGSGHAPRPPPSGAADLSERACSPACPRSPPQRGSSAQGAQQEDGWGALEAFAETKYGEPGLEAARFLRRHRPERDATLPADLLAENLRLAFEARARFPWAKDVPNELFLNDVLPYAILDEKRESWRPMLLELTAPIVAESKTASEAVQAINRQLYDKIKVHYNTGRKRPNACATESIEQGRATCTGLTILLVEACRSVGIPARAAGVFLWHDDRATTPGPRSGWMGAGSSPARTSSTPRGSTGAGSWRTPHRPPPET